MTKLLDRDLEAARRMPPEAQDALAVLMLNAMGQDAPQPLDPEHRAAVLQGLADAEQGAFASEDDIAAAFDRFLR